MQLHYCNYNMYGRCYPLLNHGNLQNVKNNYQTHQTNLQITTKDSKHLHTTTQRNNWRQSLFPPTKMCNLVKQTTHMEIALPKKKREEHVMEGLG